MSDLRGVRPFGQVLKKSASLLFGNIQIVGLTLAVLWLPVVLAMNGLEFSMGAPAWIFSRLSYALKLFWLSAVILIARDAHTGDLRSGTHYIRSAFRNLDKSVPAFAILYAIALAQSLLNLIADEYSAGMVTSLFLPFVFVVGLFVVRLLAIFVLHSAVISNNTVAHSLRESRRLIRYSWERIAILVLFAGIVSAVVGLPFNMRFESVPGQSLAPSFLAAIVNDLAAAVIEAYLWIVITFIYLDLRSIEGLAPYGSWRSPITSELVASGSIPLGDAKAGGDKIYALENRPLEDGRNVIVLLGDSAVETLIPEGFNVRSRVHEYGGGAWTIHDGVLHFVNYADQRIYRLRIGSDSLIAVTPEAPYRYADGIPCSGGSPDGRFIYIREDHRNGDGEPVNTIVRLAMDGEDSGSVLAGGNDFYSSPVLSPDGSRIAWLTWNHPNMPWDGTELWLGRLTERGIEDPRMIAGGRSESVYQPSFSPSGTLHFVSDATGWWNLYRWTGEHVEALCPMEAEFGCPQWVFGTATYGFAADGTLVASYTRDGRWRIATVDQAGPENRGLTPLPLPYDTLGSLSVESDFVLTTASAANKPTAIIRLEIPGGSYRVLRSSESLDIDPDYLSVPETIDFTTARNATAHALFYPPTNPKATAPTDELPPVIVVSHGGPTGSASIHLSYGVQFWTSRGIGVIDVNYGGSSGYGRAYRERLLENWGLVDVEDCIHAARHLAESGKADPKRLIIRGGSAGGYTTLCALAFHDVFAAGAGYYGVSDLEALALETHKFESRYLDSLIGPYPKAKQVYRDRSPIHAVDSISCPIILFQGLDDRVVPPSQSERMYLAVRKRGIPVAYIAYEGEQHGFRKAENRRHSIESELAFYAAVLDFTPADAPPSIRIDNLPQANER